MVLFGEYSFKDIKAVSGVEYARFKEWGFQPSIGKASGPGTRNVYSRHDLYQIHLYKSIFEGGWYRGPAKRFIDAIPANSLEKLIASGYSARFTILLEMFETQQVLSQEEIAVLHEAEREDPLFGANVYGFLSGPLGKSYETIDRIYDCIRVSLDEWDSTIRLLLFFFRDRDKNVSVKHHVQLIVPCNDSHIWKLYENQKREAVEDLFSTMAFADDTYCIEFTGIITEVDHGLLELYPNVVFEDFALMLRFAKKH